MEKPYSFWRALFCNHEWKKIQDLVYYSTGPHPTRIDRRWECKKCLKIKSQKIL